MVQVSIIIVNYNTKQLTINCINSIFKKTSDITFEIILVDNASTDGSVDFFSKDERIIFISNSENVGFGRANNIGLTQAKGKYLLFLNSDTILIDNVIKEFYVFAEQHAHLNIGAIGGLLLSEDGNLNHSFGKFPSAYSVWYYFWDSILQKLKLTKGYQINKQKQIEQENYQFVDYIAGADLFVPASVLMKIGVFDPIFFMYYEETDLQKRMANQGLARIVINNHGIIHLEGASFDKTKQETVTFSRYIFSHNSLFKYIKKHFTGLQYIGVRFTMFAMIVIRISIVFRKNFTFRERLIAYKQGIIANEVI